MNKETPARSPEPTNRSYLATRFEQLATFVGDPNAREILAEGKINPVRALVIRAFLATPGLPKYFYERTHFPEYRQSGYHILGAGTFALTVEDGPKNVLKFYPHTSGNDELSQQAAIDTWTEKQAMLLEHLEEYTVPQTFSIEEHPLNPSESIVTARQERIISAAAINACNTQTIPLSARPFLVDSQAMYANSTPTAVPDLLGRNNVLIERHTGSIKLVDSIALVSGDAGDEGTYTVVSEFLDKYQ